MSLNTVDNVLSNSTSGLDAHLRLRPNGGDAAARLLFSSDDDEDDDECEDIVFQLPKWTPPTATSQRLQQRSRSFPRRWKPSGSDGLRRAVGRLSTTGRLTGRRSVPSSWEGRRALEQALLFAAAVPLKASSYAAAAAGLPEDRVDPATEPRPAPHDTSNVTAIYPEETEYAQQSP